MTAATALAQYFANSRRHALSQRVSPIRLPADGGQDASSLPWGSRRRLDNLRSVLPVHAAARLRLCAPARTDRGYEKADRYTCGGSVPAPGLPADPFQRGILGSLLAPSAHAVAHDVGGVCSSALLCGLINRAPPAELALSNDACGVSRSLLPLLCKQCGEPAGPDRVS